MSLMGPILDRLILLSRQKEITQKWREAHLRQPTTEDGDRGEESGGIDRDRYMSLGALPYLRDGKRRGPSIGEKDRHSPDGAETQSWNKAPNPSPRCTKLELEAGDALL